MDYEKKIREYMVSSKVDQLYKSMLINLFPELAESEDEKIINNIKKVIGWYRGMFTEKSLMPEEYQEINAWLEKQVEQKPILDVEIPFGAKDSELEEVSYNVPNGYHAEIEDNKVVIKKGEQKPVEWNEEDELWLDNAIEACKAMYGETSDTIAWLKSLRPQSTWKPSDEQIKALNYVVNLMASSERPTENDLYYNILKSLRQQLMKLKG